MKLLAYRKRDGLGDWMMAMSVLKMVNQQYPDIDIDVYVEETRDEENSRQQKGQQAGLFVDSPSVILICGPGNAGLCSAEWS